MSDNTGQAAIEKMIMERIEKPGWTTTRAILKDPAGAGAPEEHAKIEAVMKDLAEQGKVRLWRLRLEQEKENELIAAARPDLELDKDLETRGAWAVAAPY
jgi:hypothetical protein